ncbi:MAG TPA: hypothetical protein VJ992_03410 [Gemmatimonadales bacterium]|nr:hypothetical protein [Gemmatimonadales bacterium]
MRFARLAMLGLGAAPLAARAAVAQRPADTTGAPIVDSIAVTTYDIFRPDEAKRSALFRLTNALHVTTRVGVVRRELLFQVGQPYDSARVAETARNLRALGIFHRVVIDTSRVGGRLIVHVTTSDAWSTQLDMSANSTGGTFTWALGVTEQNFVGTANLVGIDYRQEADRTALRLSTKVRRAFGTHLNVGGYYDDLSDGRDFEWNAGLPFLQLSDRQAVTVNGSVVHRQLLQWRDGQHVQTYLRTALVQGASISVAPIADPGGYVRLGLLGQVRDEEYVNVVDTLAPLPDSIYAEAGAYAELFRTRFKVVRHYNGFAQDEDLDLSTRLRLELWAAPSGFGYRQSGVIPAVTFQTGASFGKQFVRLEGFAHGLFTSDGVDSSRVWGSLTIASQALPRQATVLHIEAASQTGTPPGSEIDLGHGIGPRGFGPHAFTGTRGVWGTFEQRAFVWDQVFGVLGVGFAGFVDYGGAWYPDETRRFGGDVGFGLRIGSTRSSGTNVGRIDLAYRFGDGFTGKRWVVSLGRSYEF